MNSSRRECRRHEIFIEITTLRIMQPPSSARRGVKERALIYKYFAANAAAFFPMGRSLLFLDQISHSEASKKVRPVISTLAELHSDFGRVHHSLSYSSLGAR